MTNLFLLLMLGGCLAWIVTAVQKTPQSSDILTNIMAGSTASFIAGLIASGGTLFSGLGLLAYGAAGGSTLITLGLLTLLKSRRSR